MKKVIVALASAYLFLLFLFYCGVFRNNKDPADITRYYYDCIKNGEWFLTYQICEPSYFDVEKIFGEYLNRKLYRLERIVKIDTLAIKGDRASFAVQLLYKDKEIGHSIVELVIVGGRWFISNIKYL